LDLDSLAGLALIFAFRSASRCLLADSCPALDKPAFFGHSAVSALSVNQVPWLEHPLSDIDQHAGSTVAAVGWPTVAIAAGLTRVHILAAVVLINCT
jgi:hypothetical protein